MTGRLFRNKFPAEKTSGFTLIEMIIAVSIFSLVVLIGANIYLTVNNAQRRVVAMQKTQDDIRFVFEALAQNIRLSKINYPFYTANSIDLHPDATPTGSSNYVLALVNQANVEIFFRRSSSLPSANDGLGTKVQYCEIGTSNTCALNNDSLWQDITPAGVEVQDLRFVITPTADPFVPTAGVLSGGCTGKNAPCDLVYGYSCPVAGTTCVYYTDGANYMPKVKIILKTKGVGRNRTEETDITMQTTVSSRLIVGPVENDNHE